MEITFVRHGETDLNKENRIQGSATNYPLNEAGEAYARKAAAAFDPEAYDVVFVSPLTRAKQTAEIFTKGKQDLIVDSRITEFDFGEWDGALISELKQAHPDAFDEWNKVNERYLQYAPSGESFEHLAERCQDFLNEVIAKNPDGKVLAICHGSLIRMLAACLVAQGQMENFQTMDNCALAKFECHPNSARMLFYNRILAK